jgi:ubiquinone/menaquinone biosynthesis C-methylase UbiE
MTQADHGGALGAVYGAKDAGEIAALYDGWASGYDAEMARLGYRHPAICLALLARHLPRGAGPVLDAGAGTGLMGEWLAIVGYPEAEALDISEGMLSVARAKGVYRRLHRLALGQPLPFQDGHFAGVISSGVFTTGHVGPEGLPELIRVTRSGGAIVLTVKTTLWDGGFRAAVEDHAAAGRLSIAERTGPYVSMPGEPGTIPSLAVALRVA